MSLFKKILLRICLLIILPIQNQVINLGVCAPNKLSDSGLEAIKRAIGSARIVVIGEVNIF